MPRPSISKFDLHSGGDGVQFLEAFSASHNGRRFPSFQRNNDENYLVFRSEGRAGEKEEACAVVGKKKINQKRKRGSAWLVLFSVFLV